MSTRQDLIATATKWLSLWNTPIDWALFDSIIARGQVVRRWGEWDISAHHEEKTQPKLSVVLSE